MTPYRRALEAAAARVEREVVTHDHPRYFTPRTNYEFTDGLEAAAAIRALPDEPAPPPGDIEAVAREVVQRWRQHRSRPGDIESDPSLIEFIATALRDERERHAWLEARVETVEAWWRAAVERRDAAEAEVARLKAALDDPKLMALARDWSGTIPSNALEGQIVKGIIAALVALIDAALAEGGKP